MPSASIRANLFTFGSFSYDPDSILAGIQPLTLVHIELRSHLSFRIIFHGLVRLELSIAVFADAKGYGSAFYDSEITLGHAHSFPQAGELS